MLCIFTPTQYTYSEPLYQVYVASAVHVGWVEAQRSINLCPNTVNGSRRLGHSVYNGHMIQNSSQAVNYFHASTSLHEEEFFVTEND
jgi:hypothetical protein